MVKCPPYTEKLAEFVDRIAPAQIITAEADMLLCAVRGPWPACQGEPKCSCPNVIAHSTGTETAVRQALLCKRQLVSTIEQLTKCIGS